MPLRFLALAILVTLASALSAAERLRLGISAWAAWTPALAGQVNGIWQEEGIDVVVQVYPDDAAILADMEKGACDIALAMIGNFVGEQIKGRDLVILGEVDWSHGGDKVVIRRGLSTADLRGTTIGIYLDQPSVRFFLHRALGSYRLNDHDVVCEEVTDPIDLAQRFIDGRYPMIVNYDPQALRAVRQGNGTVVASSATFPGVIPEGFGMLRARRAQLSEETLAALFRGWFRCVAWSQQREHWDAYVEILRQGVFGPHSSEADLLTMVAAVSIHDPAAAALRNAPGGGLEAYLRDLGAYLRESGAVDAGWSPTPLLDTGAFLKACKAR